MLIDHCTRFVQAAISFEPPTAAFTAKVLRDYWVRLFLAPGAILVDRGSEFTGQAFKDYVLKELAAQLIYTSAYYPQGNGINEAVHKELEKSIGMALEFDDLEVEKALEVALQLHNSVPHSATGVSPYSSMFGFEPTFPGWQHLRQDDATSRRITREEANIQRWMRRKLQEEEREMTQEEVYNPGDWVVYHMSSYEQERTTISGHESGRFAPCWSLPHKVVEVKKLQLVLSPIGCPELKRDVPVSKVRMLRADVPRTLQPLVMSEIQRDLPRLVKQSGAYKSGKEIQNYKEILDAKHQSLSSMKENEDETLTGNKRSRPNGYDQH